MREVLLPVHAKGLKRNRKVKAFLLQANST